MQFNQLYRLGADLNEDPLHAFRTVVTNLIPLFICPLFLLWSTVFYTMGSVFYGTIYMAISITFFMALLANKKGHFLLAKYIIFLCSCFTIEFSVIAFGLETQAEVYLSILMLFVFILFENKRSWIINSIIVFTTFISTFLYIDLYGTMSPEMFIPYSYYLNFGVALIGMGAFSAMIFKTILNYIKALKESNKKLIEQKDIIEDQRSELELFTAMASHDLKTPVNTISSFLQLIKKKIDATDEEELKTYLNFALEGSSQLDRLITGISAYKRLDQETKEVVITDPNLVLSSIKRAVNTNSDPNVRIEYKELEELLVSETHLYHLFQNIIENGLKYNEEEVKQIQVWDERKGDDYIIKISDNGIGIDSKFSDYVFEPFKKLHPNSVYKGSGMGLSICKKIMSLYQGSISFTSCEGKGTIFSLQFPEKLIVRNEYVENLDKLLWEEQVVEK